MFRLLDRGLYASLSAIVLIGSLSPFMFRLLDRGLYASLSASTLHLSPTPSRAIVHCRRLSGKSPLESKLGNDVISLLDAGPSPLAVDHGVAGATVPAERNAVMSSIVFAGASTIGAWPAPSIIATFAPCTDS
jgi:hypothetical protein